MSPAPRLLDVNFLVALAWPNHLSHGSAVKWFKDNEKHEFATCPITETGFVRISMNPKITGETVDLRTVLDILSAYRSLPNHVFWTEELSAAEALAPFRNLFGHRQITDTYLLSLALRKGGSLVTFDRGIRETATEETAQALVVLE